MEGLCTFSNYSDSTLLAVMLTLITLFRWCLLGFPTVNLLLFSFYLINTIWRDASISCKYPILIIYLLILTGICWWFLLAKVGVYLMVVIFLLPSTVIIWNSSVKKPSVSLIYLYNHLFMSDSGVFRELSLFSNRYIQNLRALALESNSLDLSLLLTSCRTVVSYISD